MVTKTKSKAKKVVKKTIKTKKRTTKKIAKKIVKKIARKKTIKKSKNLKIKQIILNKKPHKLNDDELKEVLNILKAKNDVRGFVTFGEILNLIPYPELNIKGLDHIFNILFNDNVTITKNLDILEVDKDLSIDELVRSTSLEE
jgi:hypothetical protein